MTLARWSGDAYLLTSQKLLQDQYEREFGAELQIVKGRDNYACDRYPGAHVPTSRGACRRPRGPICQCPYVRAKAAAHGAPIFCANTTYFATLRHWHAERLRRRRLLIVDEAHNLEAQLAGVYTAGFPPAEMRAWFGGPLPHLASADDYRALLVEHLDRLAARRAAVGRGLAGLSPPPLNPRRARPRPLRGARPDPRRPSRREGANPRALARRRPPPGPRPRGARAGPRAPSDLGGVDRGEGACPRRAPRLVGPDRPRLAVPP